MAASWGLAWVLIPSMNAGTTFETLVHFSGPNGKQIDSGLIQGTDGSFYGATVAGGTNNLGTVFRLGLDGTVTTLYSFTGGSDGSDPFGRPVQAADGTLYGTTSAGGDLGWGTVFKITTNGAISVLKAFDTSIAKFPDSGLMLTTDGNLYGVGKNGGTFGAGTVYRVSPEGGVTTLVSFNTTNGNFPIGKLMQAADGNLYGTTGGGGTSGWGTVFKMAPDGTLATLFSFNGTNGAMPYAELVQGEDGYFYGTAAYGGVGFDGTYHSGNGTVFKLSADGTMTILHSFAGGGDGSGPIAGLVEASDGNFYGATYQGGAYNFYGTIFRVSPVGDFTTLYSLNPLNSDGANPDATLILATDGCFYGTTQSSGDGTVFRLSVPIAPLLQIPAQTPQGLQLTWKAAASQAYQVQYSADLGSTNWTALGPTILATNGIMSALDNTGLDNQRFYRVVVLP
jgi:uncharacterized repeat protein (TIGR03803 family)